MKKIIIRSLVLFILTFGSFLTQGYAQVPQAERDALIALYNATDGPNWTNNTNWNTTEPVSTWYGVGVTSDRVISLSLRSNNMSGQMPAGLGNLSNLQYLDLSDNQLTGIIPMELGILSNLQQLYLSINQLTGSIPPELGNLLNLQDLYLRSNQLTGTIPPELGNLINLQVLYLDVNQLTGIIPMELGILSNLQYLWLGGNQLTGSIPPELGNLSNLKSLRIYDNQLSGFIPPELGNLLNLQDLWLSGNQLSGSIPLELGNLINLQVLYLDVNLLSGNIPPELGNLSNLLTMVLGYNQLTGSIPQELGNLSILQALVLSNNQLTGPIPPDLGNLTNLASIQIEYNNLTDLPDLTALVNLTYFPIFLNNFTFEDIETNVNISGINYIPQNQIPGPGPINLNEGDELNISIPIGGSANQYQWVKNGVNIEGATSDNLTIGSVTVADNGVYQLIITNSLVPDLTLTSELINVSVDGPGLICESAIEAVEGTNTSPIAPFWFTYTATGDEKVTISSIGNTTEDTYLQIYDVCNGTQIAENDNSGEGLQSQLSIVLTPSESILILWDDTYSSAGFDWTLAIGTPVPGDVCETAGAAMEGINTNPNAPFWFTYTATGDEKVTISSIGNTTEDTYLRIYDVCNGTQIAENDDSGEGLQSQLSIVLTPSESILILWDDTYSSAGFDWTLTIGTPVPGDVCETAIAATEGVNTAPNAPFWFTYTAAGDETLTISSVGNATEDTYLYIYDDCNGTIIAENDDSGGGLQSQLDIVLTPNETIKILWADEYSSAGFDWTLSTQNCVEETWYVDTDSDGFGDPSNSQVSCSQPVGYVLDNTDCDDTNALITNGPTWYADTDGDSYGNPNDTMNACTQPVGYVADNTDCDDTNGTINPETLWYADTDGDGFGNSATFQVSCTQPLGFVLDGTDCDDSDAMVVGAQTWYADSDADGFGNPANSQVSCTQPVGYILDNSDCDDTDALVTVGSMWYADTDGDSFGNPNSSLTSCTQPVGYIINNTDCDDTDAAINPNTIWYADTDGDGFGDTGSTQTSCTQPTGFVANSDDCLDTDADVYPGAPTLADGKDNDCDGSIDKVSQIITFEALPDVEDGSGDIALVASSNSQLTVSFAATGPATLDGTILTLTGAGSITVTASQAGDDGYLAADEVLQSFCVNPVPVAEITFNGSTAVTLTSNYTEGNQWFMNEVSISGATNQAYDPDQGGPFYVEVSIDGCQGVSNTIDLILTEIENNTLDNYSLNIYPMPVSSTFTIDTRNLSSGEYAIRMVDITGKYKMDKRISIQENSRKEINVNVLPQGTYTLILQHGMDVYIQKIIKN